MNKTSYNNYYSFLPYMNQNKRNNNIKSVNKKLSLSPLNFSSRNRKINFNGIIENSNPNKIELIKSLKSFINPNVKKDKLQFSLRNIKKYFIHNNIDKVKKNFNI